MFTPRHSLSARLLRFAFVLAVVCGLSFAAWRGSASDYAGVLKVEPNEGFTVHLSNAVDATIAEADGTGAIQKDGACPVFATVYVDDSWVGTAPGADPDGPGPATNFGCDSFATIQGGVDGVASGGTVIVRAGTYPEAILVNKPVTLQGAQAGQNANTRFLAFVNAPPDGLKANPAVESVITAAAVNPGSNVNNTVHVMADNVTIDGFVVDGNNPALPAGGAVVVGGINTDSRRGIETEDGAGAFFAANGVQVKNNVIQNFAQRGVELVNPNGASPATSGSLITGNLVRNFGLDGIVLAFNACADITLNTVVTPDYPTEAGIWVQDFGNGATPASITIANNNVTVGQDNFGGIWVNLAYLPTLNINNNTVNAAASVTSGSDFTYGIYVTSLRPGSNASLNGNIVGSSGGTFDRGIALWNLGTGQTTTVTGGTVGHAVDGVSLHDNDPNFGLAGSNSAVDLSGVSISGTTVGVLVDAVGSTGDTVAMQVFGNTSVSGGSTGISVLGANASANIHNNAASIHDNSIGIHVDGGSATIISNNLFANGTGLRFTSGATATAHFNRIVSTTTAIDNPNSLTLNLENNWWGCNAGPSNAGCGAVTGTGADFNPWIVLLGSATPSTIAPGGTSTVTADMTHNSDGAIPVGTLPNIPVGYSATNGTMTPASDTIVAGTDSSLFTSTNSSNAVATITVDNQLVNVPITVTAPSFSIDDVTHLEGNGGPGTTSYTFTITKTGAGAASVDYATVDGSATAPSDYTAIPITTVSFLSTDLTMQFTVLVNGDTTFEGDEAFTVHLSNASGATISDADGTGTITNDDTCAAFATVYVDDSWVGTPIGNDPDGVGPATSFGCDSFATIQEGVTAVTAGGTVIVNDGTYTENVSITKAMTLKGAQFGVDARGRAGAESTVSPLAATSPTFNVAFTGLITIDGFSFSGGPSGATGVIFTATGPNNNMQISNNRFSGYPAAAIWMNRGGSDITIDKNVMDGSNIAGGGQAIFGNGPQSYAGLFITNNNIINHPGRYGFFVDGNNNVGESATRAALIGGNLFNNNLQSLNLGSRSFGKLGAPLLGTYAGAISNNTFSNNIANGIQAGIQHVLVSGNTFSGNPIDGLALTSFGNTGADRGAQNSLITGNTFTTSGRAGIFFSGTQGVGLIGTNHANFNRFVGNVVGVQYGGSVAAGNNATIDVENNWWGCNFGPGTGGAGCTGTPNGTLVFAGNTGVLDSNPWIVLGVSASPNPIPSFGMSTVTADMTKNSDGATPVGTLPDMPVAWSATNGTMAPPAGTITAGLASSTFTSTSTSSGTACAHVDSQDTCAGITVTCTGDTWTGATSSDWHTASNWACNVVPSSGADVTLPAGVLSNEAVISSSDVTVNNLTLGTNRTLMLSVNHTLTVNGLLSMNGGNITVDPGSTLIISASGSISRTSGYIIGAIKKIVDLNIEAPKTLNPSGPVALSFIYPVGTANGFSPVLANFTSGLGELTIKANQGPQPDQNPVIALQRYWTLSGTGITADLTFNYLQADVMGNEAIYRLFRVAGGVTQNFPHNPPGVVIDTSANTAFIANVSNFSDWTLGEPGAPTAVELASFKATGYDGVVFVEWQTGFEVSNLGFNVYREQAGGRALVNSGIIAGSALKVGATVAVRAGYSYGWWDKGIADCGSRIGDCQNPQYWLESVDLNGVSTWHGPVSIAKASGPLPEYQAQQSKLLSTAGASAQLRSVFTSVEATASLPQTTGTNLIAQKTIASRVAMKLAIKQEGWYRVTRDELLEAGLAKDTNTRNLQLMVDGVEQPMLVAGKESGSVESFEAIEFYGVGTDSPYSNQRTYWLVAGNQPGRRVPVINTKPDSKGAASFPFTVERKERSVYFSSLLNSDAENWFGGVVTSNGIDQPITIRSLDEAAEGKAELEIALQGVTSLTAIPDHQVQVRVNNQFVGYLFFDGRDHKTERFAVPLATLTEGDNLVTLRAGDSTDVSLVDRIRLTYPHKYAADNNSLKLTTAAASTSQAISGFTANDIRVFDVTDAAGVRELIGVIEPSSKTSFSVEVGAQMPSRILLALTTSQFSKPESITANHPSSLRDIANKADFVIISGRDWVSSLEPLKALREKQGLVSMIVDVEDVFDEFSFGQRSPYAVRSFLSYARSNWSRKPRFVLFAGDASLDPRNYTGLGDTDSVPTKLVDTGYMETASDDWLADFNDDGIAEIAVGRLPIRSRQEAVAIVNKLLSYDLASPSEEMVLFADLNDGIDFESASTQLLPLVPSSLRVSEVFRSRNNDATTKANLLEALNRGQKIVNSIGHGSVSNWRANMLTVSDAQALTNSDGLPLFVMMNCLNGYFEDPQNESLAEALMRNERGGAIAVWASSGMTFPNEQALINQQLYRTLFGKTNLTLGEHVRLAKLATSSADVRRSWILFGDPTLRLK